MAGKVLFGIELSEDSEGRLFVVQKDPDMPLSLDPDECDIWYLTPPGLDGQARDWVVALRLYEQNHQFVIGELRLFPEKGHWASGGPGGWAALAGIVPEGGITARLLRELKTGDWWVEIRAMFKAMLANPESAPWREALTAVTGIPNLRTATPPHPGRRGYAEADLAAIAEHYVDCFARAPRRPTALLAEERGITHARATSLINTCRNVGFLDPPPGQPPSRNGLQGRGGGVLTDKAKQILAEGSEEGEP